MPSLSSPSFYSELFNFDFENATSFKKLLCEDELCKKFFYEQERLPEEEKHEAKLSLTPGQGRSRHK